MLLRIIVLFAYCFCTTFLPFFAYLFSFLNAFFLHMKSSSMLIIFSANDIRISISCYLFFISVFFLLCVPHTSSTSR